MVLSKFPDFYDKYMAELGEQINASFDLRITPLADVHFQKDELSYDQPKGNMNYVYIMGIIGVLLIVIASINYTNLTTARATNRAKEIGIRKVGGANKKDLAFPVPGRVRYYGCHRRFAGSIAYHTGIAFFNNLTSKTFDWTVVINPQVIVFIFGISVITGLLSGWYPSTYLASINPVSKQYECVATSNRAIANCCLPDGLTQCSQLADGSSHRRRRRRPATIPTSPSTKWSTIGGATGRGTAPPERRHLPPWGRTGEGQRHHHCRYQVRMGPSRRSAHSDRRR